MELVVLKAASISLSLLFIVFSEGEMSFALLLTVEEVAMVMLAILFGEFTFAMEDFSSYLDLTSVSLLIFSSHFYWTKRDIV